MKVLVVDDNADSANVLALMLKLVGHDSEAVFSGAEALAAAPTFHPAVVFLDLGMPGMDGYETARRLHQLPQMSGAVLVAMTGRGEDEDRRQAAAVGFHHYLVKPAEPEDVERLLREIESSQERHG